ncbi:MAG: type I 3-dehydroquinate dehydratase [bacterium]
MTPRICLSVGNAGLDDVYAGIDYAKSKGAGFIELRFDMLKETAGACGLNASDILEKIEKLISYAKDNGIKIIGTNREADVNAGCRISAFKRKRVLTLPAAESGKNIIDSKNCDSAGRINRIEFLKSVIDMGADICDIELDVLERRIIKDFIDFAHSKNSEVILSVHDFNGQVDLFAAIGFYIDSRYLGADYFKLADTVTSENDVPRVLEKNIRLQSIKITDADSFPEFIVFGMGEKGRATRAFSLIYGSYLAYCSSPYGITAPGQAGIDDFNEMMKCAGNAILR